MMRLTRDLGVRGRTITGLGVSRGGQGLSDWMVYRCLSELFEEVCEDPPERFELISPRVVSRAVDPAHLDLGP